MYRSKVRAKCQECGYTGSLDALELHNCDVAKFGGFCEDYPSCGHLRGECQNRPEFTADYYYDRPWLLEEPGTPEFFEALDERDGVS